MARKPKFEELENGDVSMRVVVPRPIVLIARIIGRKLHGDLDTGMLLFFTQVASMLNVGEAAYLGPMFEGALKEARNEHFGVVASGPPIDVSVLHKSNKLKSGYVGVYANGNGFRAVGPGGKYIVTTQSVEEAAWRRRLFYIDNKLPYGELEIELDKWRADPAFMHLSDYALVGEIMTHACGAGYDHLFTEEANRFYETHEAPLRVESPIVTPALLPAPREFEKPADAIDKSADAFERSEREKERADREEEQWQARQARGDKTPCNECGRVGPHLCN